MDDPEGLRTSGGSHCGCRGNRARTGRRPAHVTTCRLTGDRKSGFSRRNLLVKMLRGLLTWQQRAQNVRSAAWVWLGRSGGRERRSAGRAALGAPWPPPPWGALVRGALVGRCRPLSHLGVSFSRFSFSRGVKGFLSVLCRVSLERPGTQAGAAGDPSWAASSPGPPAAARPPEPPGSACGRRVRFSSRVLRDTQDGPSRSQAASAGRRCPNACVP